MKYPEPPPFTSKEGASKQADVACAAIVITIVIIVTVIAHVNHESIQGIIHTALLFAYLDFLGKSASVLFYAFL